MHTPSVPVATLEWYIPHFGLDTRGATQISREASRVSCYGALWTNTLAGWPTSEISIYDDLELEDV